MKAQLAEHTEMQWMESAIDSQSESQSEHLRVEVQLTQPAADPIDVQLRNDADSQRESQSEHLRVEVQLTQPAADVIDVQLGNDADSQSESQKHLNKSNGLLYRSI